MPPAPRKPSVQPFKGFTDSIDDPLEYLRSETYRMREVCAALERVVNEAGRADEIVSACEILSVDLPLHLLDVNGDLAPLLENTCKPSDNVGPVIEELDQAERVVRAKNARAVSALLKHLERGPTRSPTPATRRLVIEIVSSLRRLSALESGILIPLARVRLDEARLSDLGQRMKMRRGRGSTPQQ